MDLQTSFLSSIAAVIVVLCVSLLIEKCGGRIGGILGSIPHVAVIATIGLYAQLSDSDFLQAMLGMPLGLLASSFYLGAIFMGSLNQSVKLVGHLRITVIIFFSFAVFGGCLELLLQIFELCDQESYCPWATASGSWLIELCIGLLLCSLSPGAPSGNLQANLLEILLRGIITFAISMFSFWLSAAAPALGGALLNAPIIPTIVIVVVWLAQGEQVAIGTCGPMALGMLSCSGFGILEALFVPEFGLVIGLVISWSAAIVFVTMPLVLCHHNKQKESPCDSDLPEKVFLTDNEKIPFVLKKEKCFLYFLRFHILMKYVRLANLCCKNF